MTESQKWFLLAGFAFGGALLYLLSPVLTPFLIAAVFAYIGDPLVDRLEDFKLSRTLSVITVFITLSLIVLVLLLILLPMLERQFVLLGNKLPGYLDILQHKILPILADYLGLETSSFDLASLKSMVREQWGGAARGVFNLLSSSGMTILAWGVNLVMIPVVTFYLLRDWDTLIERVHELIPRRYEPAVVRLAKASDEVLGAFLRGQLTVMLALGVIYSVGLSIVGLELALLIGMLAGLVSFVPYLGTIVGVVMAGVAALMQFQELLPLLFVALVFGVGQMTEGMLLTPLLVGDKIGMHPVAVIFAVLAGGQLFGFFGILLALPVAAVVMVLLRYTHERYVGSRMYAEGGEPPA
ncbi:MAG: AI-2E family transporter [Gammaproteobacteria bacterium]|nr:AI-2E family transporter [Gammaproteobacteria bacterium]MCW9089435.1 AI-2E family transporter [Gammaproteobacteria bacterium]